MSINHVLTDKDRAELAAVIDQMRAYWPEMFARKIPQSLVQFAYCYNTVLTLHPLGARILCAGSYEDIVGECLKLDGYNVVGIDPLLNCDLHTFTTRTDRKFDIVLSASVLEHVPDDEQFVAECCQLLLPGGIGVFTVDFKDTYIPGDRLPTTDVRFFTRNDLEVRLRQVLKANGCDLIEEPVYTDTDNFNWEGIDYSFASWIFIKHGN
jgi:SAM-dependent methyltransferase